MAILLTGGAGYIGSHICVELLANGFEAIVVDNFSNSHPESIHRVQSITGKKIVLYEADVSDKQAMASIFRNHSIEAVIHLAGYKAVGESVEKPLDYYRNNIVTTNTLLEIMQSFRVKKLVFSSTAAVYAPGREGAIAEDCSLGPVNPYGRTKWMIEMILRDLYVSDPAWSISCLRYFNPVGAHPSGWIGENPRGIPNNLFPYITQVAIGKFPELRIYGGDYPTPDGTGIRDYIHVMDLAAGHVKAVEKVIRTTGIEVYNLGTGTGYSVLDMIRTFEEVTGSTVPYTIVGRRPGDVAVCYADPAKARRLLGWTANRGIGEMCADAWRWQMNNPNGYS